MAGAGYRTLCIAEKVLTEEQYAKWAESYQAACVALTVGAGGGGVGLRGRRATGGCLLPALEVGTRYGYGWRVAGCLYRGSSIRCYCPRTARPRCMVSAWLGACVAQVQGFSPLLFHGSPSYSVPPLPLSHSQDREAKVAAASEAIERDMELLGATAVEDKLQASAGRGRGRRGGAIALAVAHEHAEDKGPLQLG